MFFRDAPYQWAKEDRQPPLHRFSDEEEEEEDIDSQLRKYSAISREWKRYTETFMFTPINRRDI